MKRYKKQKDDTNNSSVYKKCLNRDRTLNCAVCPPNKGCNKKSYKKHGETKPKYKDKR